MSIDVSTKPVGILQDWHIDVPASTVEVGNLVDNQAGVIGRVHSVTKDDEGNLVFEVRGGRYLTIPPHGLVDVWR